MSDMRIGGLASGMDIDQIVSDLMKAEKTKVDKLEQDKQVIQWKQEIYNDLNQEFANFILDTKKEFGLTSINSIGTLKNKAVSSLDWVKGATSSNTDVATVDAQANAVEGSFQVSVQQLATNWSAASEGNISEGSSSNLAEQFSLANDDNIKFTITTNAGTDNEGSVTIDKTNLSNISIKDIVSEINNANIGVKASYDANVDRFFLQTTESGTASTIKIEDTSTLVNGTKFITGSNSNLKLTYMDNTNSSQYITDGESYFGEDALIDFGAAKNIVQSSNQFTINGIGLDLKSEGDFTVSVSTDIEAVYDKITKFVGKYNELVSKFTEKLDEKRYRSYTPLTEEQKESMSEKEIELWEEKAKSGLIKGDMILDRTVLSMRQGLYKEVEGVTGIFSQLNEIGIKTKSYFDSKGGQLEINEVDLKQAIQKDVDSVLELLFKEPEGILNVKSESSMSSSEIEQKRAQSGIIRRMYDNMVSGMKDIVHKAGPGDATDLYRKVNSSILIDFVTEHGSISMLAEDIQGVEDRIGRANDHLGKVEDRYWRQFTAMEKAIQQMNQQSAWLAQQFGGGM